MQNKNLKNKIRNASVGSIINFCCFSISVVLGIVAFIIPPTGMIDSSVLMFIAECGVFSNLSRIPDFIKAVSDNRANLEITRGETSIKIEGDND